MGKRKIPDLIKMKEQHQLIAVLTAYDAGTAQILSTAGIDVILVGDSLGMVALGYETTLPVTMEEMAVFTKAVVRGTTKAGDTCAGHMCPLVIADMPFLSYQGDKRDAVKNAGVFIKSCGADGVKMEGGAEIAETVALLTQSGIPVFGHIGLCPQQCLCEGGYKVHGLDHTAQEKLGNDARALQEAGACALVLEYMPDTVAQAITNMISIPTIGCGAGAYCDGQVLVFNDVIGMTQHKPKFVKQYQHIAPLIESAARDYIREVKAQTFPSKEFVYPFN